MFLPHFRHRENEGIDDSCNCESSSDNGADRSEEHVEGLSHLSHLHCDWLEFVLEPHLGDYFAGVMIRDILLVPKCVLIGGGNLSADTLENSRDD
ncbi:hypothetical protein PENTCL1PPCAC_28475, partial [Pristionchus entomophagus]